MALPLHILDPPSRTTTHRDASPSLAKVRFDAGSPVDSVSAARRSPRPTNNRSNRLSVPLRQSPFDSTSDDDGYRSSADTAREEISSLATRSTDAYINDEQAFLDTSSVPSHVPTHPIAEMQAAFEESMLDAGRSQSPSTNHREANPGKFSGSAPNRRSLVIGTHGDYDNISYNARWRATPDTKYHPVYKIMSQVVFGVHLLCQAMEQSIPEVSTILRGFVQELDGFLRRVDADLNMAMKDVAELHKNLSLPLQHVNVFDQLLDDRKYRSQTLEGNIRIDNVIKRYSQLNQDYAIDLKSLIDSNVLFNAYLARIGDGWTRGRRELVMINAAMVKNTAIWDRSTKVLRDKSQKMGVILEKSALCVFEFEKRCAAAARRSMSASRASSRASTPRLGRSEKPLPAVPSIPELSTPTQSSTALYSPEPPSTATTTATSHRHQRSNSTGNLNMITPITSASTSPPLRNAASAHSLSAFPRFNGAASFTESRPSTAASRMARPAGSASCSFQDLRAAGFVDSTSDIALFLRDTAPTRTFMTRPIADRVAAETPKVTASGRRAAGRKRAFGSFWQVFRRKATKNNARAASADGAASDPPRPRSAPATADSSASAPPYIPISAYMGGVGQGPNGMGMSMSMSIPATVPATPGSFVSTTEYNEKPRVRFDSVVGSSRQSKQSERQISRRGSKSGRTEPASQGGGKFRFVFLEKLRL